VLHDGLFAYIEVGLNVGALLYQCCSAGILSYRQNACRGLGSALHGIGQVECPRMDFVLSAGSTGRAVSSMSVPSRGISAIAAVTAVTTVASFGIPAGAIATFCTITTGAAGAGLGVCRAITAIAGITAVCAIACMAIAGRGSATFAAISAIATRPALAAILVANGSTRCRIAALGCFATSC
jgi:hypothetical protein